MSALKIALVVMVGIGFIAWAINDVERRECKAWASETSIAEWQRQQCEHHGLPLKAEVRPETIN